MRKEEEAEVKGIERLSSESLSSEEDEADVSLSDEDSLAELSLQEVLEFVTLRSFLLGLMLSMLVFPMLCRNNLFSFSEKTFFSSAVLKVPWMHFLFPLH